jgi:hypothetical protein
MNLWVFSMTWMFVRFAMWWSSFTRSERVALLAAFWVLLGVIGEEIAELKFFEPEERSRIKSAVKRFAIAILLLGLAGDVVSIVTGQAEMAALTKEAGDAKNSAESAHAAAGSAEVDAEKANLALRMAQSKLDAVSQQAEVLAYILSARRVQDVDGLKADLEKGFKETRIAFDSYVGDTESFWLCSQLVDVAKGVVMESKDECATRPMERVPITDLYVSAPSIDEAMRLSRILKKPRRVPGIFIGLKVAPEVIVTVGLKASMPLFPETKQASKAATSNTKAKP